MSDMRTIVSFSSPASPSSQSITGESADKRHPDWRAFLRLDPSLKKYKETEAIGYGIERCLYELNPELSCLSPYLIHAAAVTPVDALMALENVAGQPDRPSFPIDRHLAAFLISRWKGLNCGDLRDLGKPQRELKNLAVLRILAGIQVHFQIKSLPNLCQWMADLCSPITTQYHNLWSRTRIHQEIESAISAGELIKLVEIFGNREALNEDDEDYRAAKIEVLLIESEIKEIKEKILNRNEAGRQESSTLMGKLIHLLSGVKSARAAKKGNIRMARLYERWGNLRTIWGNTLSPQEDKLTIDFWGKLWATMEEPDSAKADPKKAR